MSILPVVNPELGASPWQALSWLVDVISDRQLGATAQESLVEAFICCEVARLFTDRDRQLRQTEEALTYEPSQTRLWQERSVLMLAACVDQCLGPFGLLSAADARAVHGGLFNAVLESAVALPDEDKYVASMAVALGLAEESRAIAG